MRQVDLLTSFCWEKGWTRREEVNGDGGRMRRRRTSFFEGIWGGLQRKWPQSDPQYETLPLPDLSLKVSGVTVVRGRSTYSCGSWLIVTLTSLGLCRGVFILNLLILFDFWFVTSLKKTWLWPFLKLQDKFLPETHVWKNKTKSTFGFSEEWLVFSAPGRFHLLGFFFWIFVVMKLFHAVVIVFSLFTMSSIAQHVKQFYGVICGSQEELSKVSRSKLGDVTKVWLGLTPCYKVERWSLVLDTLGNKK